MCLRIMDAAGRDLKQFKPILVDCFAQATPTYLDLMRLKACPFLLAPRARQRMDPQQASSARAAATSLSLLEQVRGQDSAAWGKLVFLYAPLIQHWCRQGGAREGVDDVAQEVLIAIAGGLESFQRQRTGSFRTWVKGITRYKLLDHFRRQGNQPNATGGSDAYQAMLHSPAIDDTDDPSEASDLYRRALSLVQERFEARTWQAFWQTAVDGEPTDVVANRLGMTAGAVRIARSRVLATLREEVGDLIA